MAKGQKLEIQLPDTDPQPPQIHPDIADLRERVARTEARLETGLTESPIAGEALRLAGEAHQLASQALARSETATEPPADPKSVVAVDLPPVTEPLETPLENETHQLEQLPNQIHERTRPWWHPSRLL